MLENLSLNGNNFISYKEITSDMFKGKLSHVIIEGDSTDDNANLIGEHTNMELVRCERDDGLGGYAFVLRDMTEAELKEIKARGDIEYLAMMSNVDLEEAV